MTHTPTSTAHDMDALRHEYREAAAALYRLRADAHGSTGAGTDPAEPLKLVTLPVAHLRMLFESCARDGLSRGWHAAADLDARLEHPEASIRGPGWAGLAAEVAQLATVYTDTAVAL